MITCSENLDQFAKDLTLAQAEFPSAVKDSTNPHFKSKYANFESTVEACRPALAKHGFSFMQLVGTEGEKLKLTTLILHKSAQFLRSELIVGLPKSDLQSLGSGITYLKRYTLQAALGIATCDDDDGESSMKRTAEDSAAQAKKNAAKQTQAAAAPAAQFNPTDAKQISMMLDAFKGLGILEKQILNLLGYPDMTYLQAEDMVKLKSLASDIRKNPAVKANVFGGNHG